MAGIYASMLNKPIKKREKSMEMDAGKDRQVMNTDK